MNIADFEKNVEPKIVQRGRDYYESKYIEEIELVGLGEYSATVFGSEDYHIFVKLDGRNNIVEHTCTCPYDWGSVCKHRVAVFYHLKYKGADAISLEDTTMYKMEERLKQLSKKEVIDLIVELSKRNKTLREELLWEMGLSEDY